MFLYLLLMLIPANSWQHPAIQLVSCLMCTEPLPTALVQLYDWQYDLDAEMIKIWNFSANAKVCDLHGRDLGAYHYSYDRRDQEGKHIELRSTPKPDQFPLKLISQVCDARTEPRCEHCALTCNCEWLRR